MRGGLTWTSFAGGAAPSGCADRATSYELFPTCAALSSQTNTGIAIANHDHTWTTFSTMISVGPDGHFRRLSCCRSLPLVSPDISQASGLHAMLIKPNCWLGQWSTIAHLLEIICTPRMPKICFAVQSSCYTLASTLARCCTALPYSSTLATKWIPCGARTRMSGTINKNRSVIRGGYRC